MQGQFLNFKTPINMANLTIKVDYNNLGTDEHKLTLTNTDGTVGAGTGNNHDDITTQVHAGDVIHWVIQPNSRVTAITAVSAKPGNPEFLVNKSTEPTTGNFIATVKSSLDTTQVESYNIYFKIDGADEVYVDDPKIRPNP